MAPTTTTTHSTTGETTQIRTNGYHDHKDATLFQDHPGLKPHNVSPALIIVMGASGCGKSTIGKQLADIFRVQFVDGDDLHPKSNIEKMSRGEPLNDQVGGCTACCGNGTW